MEQSSPVKKVSAMRNALNYSITFGGLIVIFSLLMYILSIKRDSPIQYLSMVILIVGLVMGILNYKKNINGGFISYGRSLGLGVLIGLFTAVIMAVYTFILFSFIDPDLINEILMIAEEKTVERYPQISPEQLEMQMHYTRIFTQPWVMSLFIIIQLTFVSFIASLIISIFTQKKDDSFESNFN